MPKLSDTQLVILSAAAGRDNHAVLPLPKSIKVKGSAVTTVLKGLIKRDFVTEQPASRDQAVWREIGGKRLTLVITPAGLNAIGVEPEQASDRLAAGTKLKPKRQRAKTTESSNGTSSPSVPLAVRPGTKQALLIDLLKRKNGVTIAEIGEATGWQPHSVRGAISGAIKKKLGLNVASEAIEGRGRVYRIVAQI